MAVEQWRLYLQHQEFMVRTDRQSLMQLDDQQLHTSWQHKAFTKLLGLPPVMVSDRDPIFSGKFWKSLIAQIGIELRMSSAYRPQTDGQSERVNQCLEIYLRCFAHACPTKWSSFLSLAEY
jgi:transposase InsO family protein